MIKLVSTDNTTPILADRGSESKKSAFLYPFGFKKIIPPDRASFDNEKEMFVLNLY